MVGSRKTDEAPFWAGKCSRIVVAILFWWTTTLYPVLAQTMLPTESIRLAQGTTDPALELPDVPSHPDAAVPAAPGQAPQAPIYTMGDLEYLLAPIALFPDTLLALILPAATFPQQIDEADFWIFSNPDAARRGDFSAVDAEDWDPSVQALVRFPDVVDLLASHLDWTQSLGIAFAVQPEDVAVAVQLLRALAEKAGNLKSTPQQVITTRHDGGSRVIYIAPAHPERIYVPVYNPSIVFNTFATNALIFGTGIWVGYAWNSRWGWNNRHWNQVWHHHHVWHQPPPQWRPQPGRPGVRPPASSGPWRPDRPGVRSDRPVDGPGVRPDRPGVRPDRPADRPAARPDRPGDRTDRPGVRPDRPDSGTGRPAARPQRPAAQPERPAARPERPAARPERPAARPERPAARPERPAARPERPAARPERPATRPQQSRPQQRPQQSRPQQQRARPQQQPAKSKQQRPRRPLQEERAWPQR